MISILIGVYIYMWIGLLSYFATVIYSDMESSMMMRIILFGWLWSLIWPVFFAISYVHSWIWSGEDGGHPEMPS